MPESFDIVQISDISVGYGNYDSLAMVRSVRDLYGLRALILEPDQMDKPLCPEVDGIRVQRLSTSTPFRSLTGRIEFIAKAAEAINRIRPRVLIVRCSWNVPVLLKLRSRPQLTIYHSTESTLYYGEADPAINAAIAPLIDVVVFPEENRAARDIQRCGFHRVPTAIAYNAATPLAEAVAVDGVRPRNGRILYSGALDRNATYIDYYARPEMREIPVDLFGYVGGSDSAGTTSVLRSLDGRLCYKGYVDTAVLTAVRPQYAFSITMWNPSNENQHFACPCKFFESIASLVPAIVAPHPQCKMLVERYGCGIVMDNWEYPAFLRAVSAAMRVYGTAEYEEMVEACRTALLEELNWDCQFAKVRPLLPSEL